jgi:hypothetical protein
MLNFTLFGREFGQPDYEDPNQLKLFMRPQELMDTVKYSSDEGIVNRETRNKGTREEIMSSVWGTKRSELYGPHYASLVNSIKTHGVLRPVTIEDIPGKPLAMGQGHHRVAAANMVEQQTGKPVFIPVTYDEDYSHGDFASNFPVSLAEKQFRKKRPEANR